MQYLSFLCWLHSLLFSLFYWPITLCLPAFLSLDNWCAHCFCPLLGHPGLQQSFGKQTSRICWSLFSWQVQVHFLNENVKQVQPYSDNALINICCLAVVANSTKRSANMDAEHGWTNLGPVNASCYMCLTEDGFWAGCRYCGITQVNVTAVHIIVSMMISHVYLLSS